MTSTVHVLGISGSLRKYSYNAGLLRAQYHLRQVAVFTNMFPLNKPEVAIQRALEKFDASGKLVDEPARQQVRALLEALAAWTRRLRGG